MRTRRKNSDTARQRAETVDRHGAVATRGKGTVSEPNLASAVPNGDSSDAIGSPSHGTGDWRNVSCAAVPAFEPARKIDRVSNVDTARQ
ncbi:hypothetical protein B1756_04730 [Natrarchaeobaculum aegyptiacum]|uniref:Uncharacterized protein n=1 Tax=Natrarchaeobaculum aegyptiacum TaxID=745377 RepID=A0A2Z2HPY1_9EURY|nr:hypothetical protein B1756_04730 [Natrarchaeobaculum aegyptiacum]